MLPKISHPTFTITIPSSKKNIIFRPFLVKEEKLLLMAKESKSNTDVLNAIKQVVINCAIDNLDIDSLAIFDLEYIFLKLRSNSVDNICKISYIDSDDNKPYSFDVDLNEIEVIFPETPLNIIKINNKMGIIMNYPSAKLYNDQTFLSLENDIFFEIILRCVDKIYDGDNIYEAKNATKDELKAFFENLDGKTFIKIQNFFINMPKMRHVINYKNSLGKDKQIVLNSLNDFFILR